MLLYWWPLIMWAVERRGKNLIYRVGTQIEIYLIRVESITRGWGAYLGWSKGKFRTNFRRGALKGFNHKASYIRLGRKYFANVSLILLFKIINLIFPCHLSLFFNSFIEIWFTVFVFHNIQYLIHDAWCILRMSSLFSLSSSLRSFSFWVHFHI